jgi:hypothetical protein
MLDYCNSFAEDTVLPKCDLVSPSRRGSPSAEIVLPSPKNTVSHRNYAKILIQIKQLIVIFHTFSNKIKTYDIL